MDKILNNLGLCCKARGLITGAEFVVDGLRANTIKLIFLANDASDNTKKKILDKAKYYNCQVIQDYSCAELSQAIGKVGRMVIGITNGNFVKILKK